MYCDLIRKLLRQNRGQIAALPQSGRKHLQECRNCSAYAEDIEFDHLFRKLPVIPASLGFTDRVLQQAWQGIKSGAGRSAANQRKYFAFAACLLLTLIATLLFLFSGEVSTPEFTGNESEEPGLHRVGKVRFLVVSATDLPEAMVTLKLDENVHLDGYEEYRELRWPTSIMAGANQMTLPVKLRNKKDGRFSIHIEANGSAQSTEFTVSKNQQQLAATLAL